MRDAVMNRRMEVSGHLGENRLPRRAQLPISAAIWLSLSSTAIRLGKRIRGFIFESYAKKGICSDYVTYRIWPGKDALQSLGAVERIFIRRMAGLATPQAPDRKTIMLDATYLKAHRTASSLRVLRDNQGENSATI